VNRILVRITCLQVMLSLFACHSEPRMPRPMMPPDAAPGHISLEVSSNKQAWRFVVTPSIGSVVASNLDRQGTSESAPRLQVAPTGEANCFFQGAAASSPDDRYIAQCEGGYPGRNADFRILQTSTKSESYHWDKIGRQILGFVWSPNSQSIAVLTSSQIPGRGPLELLWAYAGHPVPHVTVYLDFIRADGRFLDEYLIMNDVVYGKGRILDWKK
jgi:hypothetical protein